MKLGNKGMTLIEIIVAIVLISIVLIFLSLLLVDVKDLNDKNNVNSSYLVNKTLLIKSIETDLMKYNKLNINSCSASDMGIGYSESGLEDNQKFTECIKLTLDDGTDTTTAFLGLYYLKTHDSYVISYLHSNLQRATYEFKDFEKYNVTNLGKLKNDSLSMNIKTINNTYKYYELPSSSVSVNSIIINIPMIGSDNNDYTIQIPYHGTVSIKQ